MRLSEMIRILHLRTAESFEKMGFTKQEFDAESEELVDVEEEPLLMRGAEYLLANQQRISDEE